MGKKDKPRVAADPGTISTLLGLDTQIEGTFSFKETIRVDGRIQGHLFSDKGTIIVGEKRLSMPTSKWPWPLSAARSMAVWKPLIVLKFMLQQRSTAISALRW